MKISTFALIALAGISLGNADRLKAAVPPPEMRDLQEAEAEIAESMGYGSGSRPHSGGKGSDCFTCDSGIFEWKFSDNGGHGFASWIEALQKPIFDGFLQGCVLAPVESTNDLYEISQAMMRDAYNGIGGNNQADAWVGVYRDAKPQGLYQGVDTPTSRNKLASKFWMNVNGAHWPVTESNKGKFFDSGEPNNDNSSSDGQQVPPEQTVLVANAHTGLLKDKAPYVPNGFGQPRYAAVYKCCVSVSCFDSGFFVPIPPPFPVPPPAPVPVR